MGGEAGKQMNIGWTAISAVAGLGGLVLDWLAWQVPGETAQTDDVIAGLVALLHAGAGPRPVWQGVEAQPQTARAGIGIPTRVWPREQGRFVYAAAWVRAAQPLEAALRVGSFVGYRVWWDRTMVATAQRGPSFQPDDNCCAVQVDAGEHVLLVEVDREHWQTVFHVRLSAPDGRDFPSGTLEARAVETPMTGQPTLPPALTTEPNIPPAFEFYNGQLNRPGELALDGVALEGFDAWHTAFGARLRALVSMPAVAPPVAEVAGRTAWRGVQIERVVLRDGPTGPIPLYVLIPLALAQPAPGVLCIHGHGAGKDDVAGITEQDPAQAARVAEANYTYALQLAQRGYVTFAPDVRAFGERADQGEGRRGRDQCDNNFLKAVMLGALPLALDLTDLRLVVDYALQRPEVDAGRFGCVGLSLGGRLTMYLAALDERITVAVASGALNTFKERLTSYAACGSQLLPGLWRYGDTPEVFGLIAPRPLLLELGTQDGTSPEVYAAEAYRRIRRAYELAGAVDRLEIDVFARGHRFHAVEALPFLERWLGER